MFSITAKLGNMKKAVEWTVYPASKDSDDITIQSDHRIAQISVKHKRAWLSVHRANGAYFVHLLPALGATVVPVPDEVITAALAAQPKSGDTLHGVVTIA